MRMEFIYEECMKNVVARALRKDLNSISTKRILLNHSIERKSVAFNRLESVDKELFEKELDLLTQYEEVIRAQIARQSEIHK